MEGSSYRGRPPGGSAAGPPTWPTFEALESRLLLDGAPPAPLAVPKDGPADGVITRRALLVGITDGENAWTYADWDMVTMEGALVNRGGWSEIIRLSGDGANIPTIANFEDRVDYLRTEADDDDLTLIYFTGHGNYIVDSVPSDEPDDLDEQIYFHDDYMIDDTLGDLLDDPWPGQFVMIIDSCHSGGMIDGSNDPGILTENSEIVAACQANESGWGDAFLGSYFTHYFAEALDNGLDSVREAYEYAATQTVIAAAPQAQNAVWSDNYAGDIYLLPESSSGDALEPNDSFAGATYLGTLGDRTESNLSIHTAGNDDYFVMTARGTGTLRVDIEFTHADGDLDLYLYDSSLSALGSSTTATDDETVTSQVTAGEIYYLRVTGAADATNRDYELAVDGPGAAGDIFESNNTFAAASDLGTVVHRFEPNLSVHNSIDDDFYQFTPYQSGQMTLDVLFSHADGDIDVELFNRFHFKTDESVSGTDNEQITATVTAGTTYFIHVYGYEGQTNLNYDLEITAQGPDGDDFEANDSFVTATDLGELGDRTETDLSVHIPGNDDYYRFTALADGTLDVDILFDHSQGNLDLRIYDLARTQLDESVTTTDNEDVTADVTRGDAYYIRVFGAGGDTNPDYDLVIDGPAKVNVWPPEALPNTYGTSEDVELTVTADDGVLANDLDDDDDTLTADLVDDATEGTLDLNPDGSFTYTPDDDFQGEDGFTYRAYDELFYSDPVAVTITVVAVNDVPTADDQDVSVTEDEFVDVVLVGDDLETAAVDLVFAVATEPEHGTVEIVGDTATYTPDDDYYGDDSFTFTVTDTGDPVGTHTHPGDETSAPATVNVTVDPVNDEPTANPDDVATDEDTDRVLDVTADLLDNDVDEDKPSLVFEVVGDVTNGTLLDNLDGTYTYTPDDDFHGEDGFTYRTFDGEFYSTEADVTITVNAVNDQPTANAQEVIANEDGTAVITLTGTDLETPDGQLVYAIDRAPRHGTAELVGDTVTYTPEEGHHGLVTFTFTVTDDGDPAGSHAAPGDVTSDPATVSVYVPLSLTPNQSIHYYDADGDTVTISLRGEGAVGVYLPAYTWCDALRIVGSGTGPKSSLTITHSGRGAGTSVGDITIDGSLRSLTGKTTNLTGDLTMTGTLGTLVLADVADDHTIDVNTAGAGDPDRDKLNVTLGRVADTSLDTHGLPINNLTVTEWLDGDASGDGGTITVPWINRVNVKGSRKKGDLSDGDFAADLTLSGLGVAANKYVLNTATIAGTIAGGTWSVQGVGTVNTIRAGDGTAAGWTLDADGNVNTLDGKGGDVAGTLGAAYFNRISTKGAMTAAITATGADPKKLTAINTLTAGRVDSVNVNAAGGGINTITVTDWTGGGTIHADWIGRITARGDRRNGVAGDWEADLDIDALALPARKIALGGVKVAGQIACLWDIDGEAGLIKADSTAATWTLTADGKVKGVDAKSGLAGGLTALTFDKISTKGDLTAAIAATGADAKKGTSIGTLTAGSVKDVALNGLPGGIQTVTVVEWIDGDDPDDLAGIIDAGWIGRLTVKGNRRDGLAGDFDADLALDGGNLPQNKPALGSTTIAGGVTGSTWTVDGDGTSVNIKGDVDDWTATVDALKSLAAAAIGTASVTVNDALGTCKAIGWQAGKLDVNTLKTLNITGQKARGGNPAIPGDFGADLTVQGAGVAAKKTALNTAKVAGRVHDNTWLLGGNVGTLTLGAMDGSEVLLGCVAATDDPADFGGNEFSLRTLTLKGVEGAFFTDSTLAAWQIGTLRFGQRNAPVTGTIEYHELNRTVNDPDLSGPVNVYEV